MLEGEYKNDFKWNDIGYDTLNNKVYEIKDGKSLIKDYYDNGDIRFEGEYLYLFKLRGKFYSNEKLEFQGGKDMIKMVILYMK